MYIEDSVALHYLLLYSPDFNLIKGSFSFLKVWIKRN